MAKTTTTAKKKSKDKTKSGKTFYKVRPNCVTYTCRYEDCNRTFPHPSNRLEHEKLHSGVEWPCPQCPYVGKTKKYLSSHTRKKNKTGIKRHKCNVCGMMFHEPSSLKNHSYVHTGERPFKCNVCDKDFRQRYSLNCHMLIHTNEKPHQCSFCDYACRDSSTLRKHQNRHMGIVKEYACRICRKRFPERAKLKYHISSVHLDYLDIVLKMHPCSICKKAFKHKHLLNRHTEIVHDRKFKCKCPVCGRPLASRYNLKAHMSTHFNERPYACTYTGCEAAFKDKSSLKKHSATHYPRLHHACKVCHKTFVRAHRRDKHMEQHYAKEKNVECDYCGVKFYNKNYLIQHIKRKHCPEKQKKKYICDHCDMVTYNKPSIVMHLKYGMCTARPNDLKCKICKYKTTYSRLEYLRSHYLRKHNIKYKPRKELKKKNKRPPIEIKIEPLDEDEPEEIVYMEIDKQEQEDQPEDEYLTYSKHVLSEDLAEYMLDDTLVENNFDKFLKKHVFHENIKDEDDPTKEVRVDKSQLENVTQKIKELLKRTKEEENRKKILKEQIREEKLKIRRKKQEIVELRKVREFYNKRMKEAVENQKEQAKKITYFDNRVQLKDKIIFANDDWKKGNNEQQNDERQSKTNDNDEDDDDIPLSERIKKEKLRVRKTNNKIVDVSDDDDKNDDDNYQPKLENNKVKFNINMHQCYECFKLFSTKEELNEHRMTSHVVINLRNTCVKKMDKKNRELKDRTITKTKLVKKGNEWVVEKVPIKIDYEEMPAFSLNELRNLYVTGNYVDRLGQLNQLCKKKGVKMFFPCDQCDKICQNFSAIKLHSRRHDPNKKPFKPKRWKHKGQTPYVKEKPKIDPTLRLAKPGPITHIHKCDPKLKEFYESHIRGANIEFWQFLKIYNRMERENIQDFKDFEGRIDFGIHNKDEYETTEINEQEKSGLENNELEKSGLENNELEKSDLENNGKEKPLVRNRKEKLLGVNRKFASGNSFAKQKPIYKRTILISRKLHLKREAEKMKMREKIAKNNGIVIC